MGDIVEFTVRPNDEGVYYKVSTRALSFSLKGDYGGTIGLSKAPDNVDQLKISFGRNGQIHVHSTSHNYSSEEGVFNLSVDEYQKFWIAWNNGLLEVGSRNSDCVIYSLPHDTPNLDYVVFYMSGDARSVVSWKVVLPPFAMTQLAKPIPSKDVTGGDLRWIPVQADDEIPTDAVIGGFEGEVLYIIRGQYLGSLTPGKFVPSKKQATVAWGSLANQLNEYEMLCGYNYAWVAANDDNLPASSFMAGHSETQQEALYIGRATHNNCLIPGKVQNRVCHFPYGGRENFAREYEVLTVPGTNRHAVGDKCYSIVRTIGYQRPLPLQPIGRIAAFRAFGYGAGGYGDGGDHGGEMITDTDSDEDL